MNKKLIMLRGISASGKTTWAKKYVAENPGSLQISKDELRAMLHDGKWTPGNEKIVLDMRDALIERALRTGRTVLVADTNLHPKHEARLRQIASEQKAEFEIKDFVVDFEEALERDAKREHPVGYVVLKQQWNDYIRPKLHVQQNDQLPSAVLCDMDGTLALLNGRSPYDASTCENDAPNTRIIGMLHYHLLHGFKIIIMSGRDSKYRPQTEAWLAKHGIIPDLLLMRVQDDKRKDAIIKEELFRAHVLPNYYTQTVFDDRDQVVRMWRDLGLNVLQVADGNF